MASRDLRDLAESQRKTVEVLRSLTTRLRRSSRDDDMERLLSPFVSEVRPSGSRLGASSIDPASTRVIALARTGEVFPRDMASGAGNVEAALNLSTRAIRDLGSTLAVNTRALEQNTSAFAGGLQGLLSGLAGDRAGGGGIGGLLRGGLGLVPLGAKLLGLFSGGKKEPASFTPFELPPSLSVEAVNTNDILSGFPRAVRGQRGELRATTSAPGAVVQPQVVVNVSALDTQSFVDRSSDIARAVREAMLHMHPVNDVIGEI